MYLVMGITGKSWGRHGAASAEARRKQVRALARNREKAAKWADQDVELMHGDWNDATAIAAALKGVEGAFVMLPAVWAPSADYREAKGVIANYVDALTRVAPPRVVALSSMGADRTSGVGMITALSLLEQSLRSLASPVAFVRAGGFFENFLFGLQAAQGGTLPVFYSPANRKSTMVASDDIGAEVAALLTGPAWSGQRVIELGSMVSADEVARQLGEVLTLDVKAFAVPRGGWAEAFGQFGVPKGHTGPAEEMFDSVNAGWMDLGIAGTEHRSGYDVRTRSICSGKGRRQGVSSGASNMKAEHTIDKAARAGRATQIAAMVITSLVAVMWVYFGRLYLIHDPGEWRIANQQLGYPLYIIPLLGVTHILGGVGLLIPNVPRLTEWVYAGLAIDLSLAFYSHLHGGGGTWDPILVMAFVFASYLLRRRMRANRWSI